MRTSALLVLTALLLVSASTFAHAGTRVNDERQSALIVAPLGAAGFGLAATTLGDHGVGGGVFILNDATPANAFVDVRMLGFSPVGSFSVSYLKADESRGDADCSLAPSPNAHATCALPEDVVRLTVWVFEDALAEVQITVWHVE